MKKLWTWLLCSSGGAGFSYDFYKIGGVFCKMIRTRGEATRVPVFAWSAEGRANRGRF